jgi:Fic family protein
MIGWPIARWDDLPQFLEVLLDTNAAIQLEGDFDPVLAATLVTFGFVFHPFADGNGRVHRYLIHDWLRENSRPRDLFFLFHRSCLTGSINMRKYCNRMLSHIFILLNGNP